MRSSKRAAWTTVLVAAAVIFAGGCEEGFFDNGVTPATNPNDAEVFIDEFGSSVTFQAFSGSKLDALQIDETVSHSGSRSLKVTVPEEGYPNGSFAGGAFTTDILRDLSGYNALTFWAKASITATLNTAGIGNDNTGTSRFTAEVNGLPLTTAWAKYVIPIPLAEKLTAEGGLFYFAEGHENGAGYDIWFDDIQFENLDTITDPAPALNTTEAAVAVGDTVQIADPTVTFQVDGAETLVHAMPGYFTFAVSDGSVLEVRADGTIVAIAQGTAEVTATLGDVDASGTLSVTVEGSLPEPQTAAPAPTAAADSVVALYSDAYTEVPVDTWSADWDQADVADIVVDGDNVKKYDNLVFAGIEFTSNPVDASGMTRFHMDIWTPDEIADGTVFKIKLVDFGADGAYGGGDDSEHEVTLTGTTTPALESGTWVGLDLPLSDFVGLAGTGSLAQLIISGDLSTVYVDNIYFYIGGTNEIPNEPTTAAPAPSHDAGSVISLFSNTYTNVPVDTWSADWDMADVSDIQIAGDDVKLYENMVFAGIEFTSNPVDASEMTHFHMDIWTPDEIGDQTAFKVKLVDFGADGAYGGGDDSEHELTLTGTTTPAFESGTWVGLDLPLSDFVGLAGTSALAQIIISGDLPTVYVDNVYFYIGETNGTPNEPATAAPAPTYDAGSVISLFSNAYSNVNVDTWSADWDQADVVDMQVNGDDVKKYANLVFAGIEFTSQTIDASGMAYFHMDLWTPNPTADPAMFKIKLVDFGADGAYGGGDDVEHELTYTASSDPALATGSWVSFDIPLSDFTNLTTRGHLAQLILSGDLRTIFVDNVLLHQ